MCTVLSFGSNFVVSTPSSVTRSIRLPCGSRNRTTTSRGVARVGGSLMASMNPLSADDVMR
jgi:hypothetical protein